MKLPNILKFSLLSLSFLTLIGCSDSENGVGNSSQNTLSDTALFKPLESSLIARSQQYWEQKTVIASSFTVLDSGLLKPNVFAGVAGDTASQKYRIVSQEVNGQKHYSLLFLPIHPKVKNSVIYYCHGGEDGIGQSELSFVLAAIGTRRDSSYIVIPSYRGESIDLAQSYISEGPGIPWVSDVEDLMALNQKITSTFSDADTARIGVVGVSRGATVAHLYAQTNPSVKKAVLIFGMSSFMGEDAQKEFELAIKGTPRDLPGVNYLNNNLIQPYVSKKILADSVRFELAIRSPLLRLEKSPLLQIHHGDADTIVNISESKSLDAGLTSLKKTHEFYTYAGQGHGSTTLLLQANPRIRTFLSALE